MYHCVFTPPYTHTHTPGFGMFDEAAFSGRLKHSWPVLFFSLVVFLSFCIPRRGAGVCPGCVCARALVLCLHASLSPLSVTGFCDFYLFLYLFNFINFFYLADVRLPSYGLRCHCACMCVCFYICLHACVLLCGCRSLVSIFIFRKCFRCLRLSTASCKPTPSCIRASWPSRRRGSGRRLLVCRYTDFPSLYSPLEKQKTKNVVSTTFPPLFDQSSMQQSWLRLWRLVTTST